MTQTQQDVVWFLFKPECFDSFISLDIGNFLDAGCPAFTISKLLSYLIILGSFLLKAPQIYKIFVAKSAKGLSEIALCIETFGCLSTAAYFFRQEYAFSTYLELPIICVQNWIVFVLIYYYSSKLANITSILVLLGFPILAYFLFSPVFIPFIVIQYIYSGQFLNILGGRLPQIIQVYRDGSTGQLAFITASLAFFGCIARLFTTLQEVNDTTALALYSLSTSMHGTLWFQFLYYWNADKGTDAAANKKGNKRKPKSKSKAKQKKKADNNSASKGQKKKKGSKKHQ